MEPQSMYLMPRWILAGRAVLSKDHKRSARIHNVKPLRVRLRFIFLVPAQINLTNQKIRSVFGVADRRLLVMIERMGRNL